jgi:hypothetical protein
MNIKKLTLKQLSWALLPALIIGFTACGDKDDTSTPPTTTTPPNTNTTPEQYILMNGSKVIIKNPANGNFRGLQGDTILEWSGNKPSAILGDSSISITHYEGVKRGVNVVDQLASEYGEVSIGIQFGITDSKTEISLKQGDYKLEKVNGIWYSVLKNGAGEATKGTSKINLTGVEFRLAWPSTFK